MGFRLKKEKGGVQKIGKKGNIFRKKNNNNKKK
jgi:hypothetical protein